MKYVEAAAYQRLLVETRAADTIGCHGPVLLMYILSEQIRWLGRQGVALSIKRISEIIGASRNTVPQVVRRAVDQGWLEVSGEYQRHTASPRHRARLPIAYGQLFIRLLAEELESELRYLADQGILATAGDGVQYVRHVLEKNIMTVDGREQLFSPVIGHLWAVFGNEPMPDQTMLNSVHKKSISRSFLSNTICCFPGEENTISSRSKGVQTPENGSLQKSEKITRQNRSKNDLISERCDPFKFMSKSTEEFINRVEKLGPIALDVDR